MLRSVFLKDDSICNVKNGSERERLETERPAFLVFQDLGQCLFEELW